MKRSVAKLRVQSFWHGSVLSPYEVMCIRSFLSHGHSYDLYSYARNLNVPDGCNLMDAREFFPENDVFFYQKGPGKGSVSLFSNAFRYKLLYAKGGWWVDTDVVCLTEILPDAPYVFGYQDKQNMICTAVIKIPPGDKLMRRCLKKALKVGANADWAETGPALITELVTKAGLNGYAKAIPAFYPYDWLEAMDALDPAHTDRLYSMCRQSIFVHLWNEMLRRNGVDKFQPPPDGSLIDHFFKQYCK